MTGLSHFLRHRPPMVFIDDILESRHEGLTAVVQVREGIPFFEAERGVPAWVGIEYMAQSVAALAGMRARNAGQEVPLGLIIGCRRYEASLAAFPPGDELRIMVEELVAEENGFGSFDCIIERMLDAPRTVVRARLTVFGGDRQEVT